MKNLFDNGKPEKHNSDVLEKTCNTSIALIHSHPMSQRSQKPRITP